MGESGSEPQPGISVEGMPMLATPLPRPAGAAIGQQGDRRVAVVNDDLTIAEVGDVLADLLGTAGPVAMDQAGVRVSAAPLPEDVDSVQVTDLDGRVTLLLRESLRLRDVELRPAG